MIGIDMKNTIKKCNIQCNKNIVGVFVPIILVDFALASHLAYADVSLMRIKSPVNIFIYVGTKTIFLIF